MCVLLIILTVTCILLISSLDTAYDVKDNAKDAFMTKLAHMLADYDLNLQMDDSDRDKIHELIDCGIHPHNKEKNIHIFIYPTFWFPEITQLKCNSFFELNGKQYPEVDDYRIIKKDERHLFNKVLQDKFEIIDKFNGNDILVDPK